MKYLAFIVNHDWDWSWFGWLRLRLDFREFCNVNKGKWFIFQDNVKEKFLTLELECHAVLILGLNRLALEYKKTPARATAVPVTKANNP